MEGPQPWILFVKTLSMKIRHMRHNAKRKSFVGRDGMVAKSSKSDKSSSHFRSTLTESDKTLSETDIKSHIKELQEEWKKPSKNRNMSHIRMLLKETSCYRDSLLRSSNSLVSGIIQEFPCFKDATYLLFEIKERFGGDKLKDVSNNLKLVVAAAHKLMGKTTATTVEENPSTMLEVIHFLEKETKFDRSGKNGSDHFRTIIDVFEGIADSEVAKKLSTKEKESPRVALFMDNAVLKAMYIVGDGVAFRCQGSSTTSAMLEMFALYYVFDIDYPKCHAMILGLLQQCIMAEPYTYQTSKKFKFFWKKIKTTLEELSSE